MLVKPLKTGCLGLALGAIATVVMAGNEFEGALKELAENTVADWIQSAAVLDAVKAQNRETAELSDQEILALDDEWRSELASNGELVQKVLSSELSEHLEKIKEQSMGRFTEIFVSDVRGLNVGQSDLTSDYWQGDEPKWLIPYETRQLHIGDVEFDESSQSYQGQISLPILEGDTFLGVITVGVDIEHLATAN